MGYFDSEKNVDAYLKMVEGCDTSALIQAFAAHVPKGAAVLELGMGGGADLDQLLEAGFDATGSDASEVFLQRYRARGGKAPTLRLDARTLQSEQLEDRRFDAIFSDKVLQHLEREQLGSSLRRQAQLLKPGGVLFHALWAGEGEEEHEGMLFTRFSEASLRAQIPESLELVELQFYSEFEENDSFWCLMRSKSAP